LAVVVAVSVGVLVGCVLADCDSVPPRQPPSRPLTVIEPPYARYVRRDTPEPLSVSSAM
jgi:hypothetical protein